MPGAFGWPGCCCPPTGGGLEVTVTGCVDDGFLEGVTVTVTKGDVTVSGVTDAFGLVTLDVPPDTGYSIGLTDPDGFFMTDTPDTVDVGPGLVTHLLEADAAHGYHCLEWFSYSCNYPVGNTVYYSDTRFGAVTLTWDDAADGWLGTQVVTYPGCPGSTCEGSVSGVEIRYKLKRVAVLDSGQVRPLTTFANLKPIGLPGPSCPVAGSGAGNEWTPTWYITSRTCPSAFAVSLAITSSPNPGVMYCDTTPTATLSE